MDNSSLIRKLNTRFKTKLNKADQLSIEQLKIDLIKDDDLKLKAATNSIKEFKTAFYKAFISKITDYIKRNALFFNKILDDKKFKDALMEYLLMDIYKNLKHT